MLLLKQVYQKEKPMSLMLSSAFHRQTTAPSRLPRLPLRSPLDLVATWDAGRRARLHFAALDDRALADVGLTRDRQRIECAKPFWKL
jgi:uncharacterized protein YjiS (DUF1127 family)